MSWFTIQCRKHAIPIPSVFVETGTFRGDTACAQAMYFAKVHTIELDPLLAEKARKRFADHPRVVVHEGDSAEVLARLADSIAEPAVFYLDAHWSGGETARGDPAEDGCPILRELQVLGRRPYADVVFVDDARLMGRKSWSGEDGSDWPRTEFDWRHVTDDTMRRAYGRLCRVFHTDDIDRVILFPYAETDVRGNA
jgi:hypothetical protein